MRDYRAALVHLPAIVPRIRCFSGSLARYSFRFISLRTLYLSLCSFPPFGPLFSIVCALFDKNTWFFILAPLSPSAAIPFLPALCFHILTNCFSRKSFLFTTIQIARGWHSNLDTGQTKLTVEK
jgi:hypothetical protein